MATQIQIEEDLIKSLKEKNELAVSTLRLLVSEIKNAKIAKGEDLKEEEIEEVIAKAAKKRKESIDAYKNAGREELADRESNELAVLEKYLPEQMSEQEVGKIVDEVIASTGASGISDIGKVMGQAMRRLKGKSDGNVVSAIVKKKLS